MIETNSNGNNEYYLLRSLPINPQHKVLVHKSFCKSYGKTKTASFIWMWLKGIERASNSLRQFDFLGHYIQLGARIPQQFLTLFQIVQQFILDFLFLLDVEPEPEQPQETRKEKAPVRLYDGARICTFKPSFKPFKA